MADPKTNVFDIESGEPVLGGRFSILEDYRRINLDPSDVLGFMRANLGNAEERAGRLDCIIGQLRTIMPDGEVGPWLVWRQSYLNDENALEVAGTEEGLTFLEASVPAILMAAQEPRPRLHSVGR